jgi:transposase
MKLNQEISLSERLESLEDQMIQALNKELREVKLERDILKKAVSIFSRSER